MKRIVTLVIILSMVFSVSSGIFAYDDVSERAWYYNDVKAAEEKGLMIGVGNGRFNPEGTVSLAQLCTVLMRLCTGTVYTDEQKKADAPEFLMCDFTSYDPDEPVIIGDSGSWYYAPVVWAYEKGIISFITDETDGTVRIFPKYILSRMDVIAMLYSFEEAEGGLSGKGDVTLNFPDFAELEESDRVSDFISDANGTSDSLSGSFRYGKSAGEMVAWAFENNIVRGYDDGTLKPSASVKRSQMAALLRRFTEAYGIEYDEEVFAENLMGYITADEIGDFELKDKSSDAAADFALRLFKKIGEKNDGNLIISPLSVLAAFSMCANGADGTTLEQMESVLGLSSDELNTFFAAYMNCLSSEEEEGKLSLANSIWFKDDENFEVKKDFLKCNANYYGADIYKAPFDETTLKGINNWVKRETDGMIPEILDRIPADAIMYLINALCFEGEWVRKYEKPDIYDGKFTTSGGDLIDAEFMHCVEGKYLSDRDAKGFIKYYKGNRFAFAALLPDEGVDLRNYISSLDGEKVREIINGASTERVITDLPKFKSSFDDELSEVLIEMGMGDAFSSRMADFSRLGTYDRVNIYISRVLHKCEITVDSEGTKAAAATVIEMSKESSAILEAKEVRLDRPFLYMLIDTESGIPFFIGTVEDSLD